MKGILKLFPAALAMLALASCSNDQLLNLDGEAESTAIEAGDLAVSFDPVEEDGAAAGTRAMRTNAPGPMTFEDGDKVNVYDADLYKHDVYKFVSGTPKGKFVVDGTQRIKENAQYALFPAGSVARGYWDHDLDIVKAEFRIPQIFTYSEASEQKIGNDVYYKFELPSAGVAEWNSSENRVDVTHFRALTGILQLNLTDALNNANWIRVRSGKKLCGTFVVELDKDNWSTIALKEGAEDLITDNEIYVDMRKVPSRVSCVYLPVIAGIDTNVDGLTVEIATDDVDDPTTIIPGNWYDIGLKFPNKTIKQNAIYRGSKEFSLTNMTPNMVSQMLEQYKSSATDIVLNLADNFTINAAGTQGNQILLPKFDNDINVTINLATTFTTWTNTGDDVLKFVDADPTEPFEGTVSFNVVNKLPATAKAETEVNLDKGSFTIAGDFSGATNQDLTLTKANSVSIGNGTTTTKIAPTAFTCGAIANLTIAAEAEFGTDITTTANNTNVTVNGKVDGDIDMSSAIKVGTLLRIHGREANATATPAITAKAAEVTGDVTAMCDVKIDLTAEGIAIANGKALTLNGYDNTLTLVQGYVDKLVAKVTNTGSWEGSKVNVVLNDAKEGLAAIKTIDAQNDGNGNLTAISFTESVWDGQVIGAAFTAYKGQTTSYQENSTPKTGKAVFTASQLASLGNADVVIVANDIDLKNKTTWPGFTLSQRMQGYLPGETVDDARTISNLNLTLAAAKGLINAYTGATAGTISGLNIETVKATKAADATGIGALIGANNATAALTISNVAITGIDIEAASGKKLENVGGVIGSNAFAVTLNNVTTAGSIDGYSALGGLIGTTSANVTTDKDVASTVTIAQTYSSAKDFDINYAKIGGFIGTITANTVDVTIKSSVMPTTPTHSHAAAEYISDESEVSGKFFSFTPAATQGYVGYCGAANVNPTQDKFPAGSRNEYKAGQILYQEYNTGAAAWETTKKYILPVFGMNNKKWSATDKVDLAELVRNDDANKTVKTPAEAIVYSFTKKN